MPDTITYKAKGQVYEIPDTEKDVFLQDFPDAMEVESFLIGKDTFDIPTAEVSGFLQEKPEAKPLKKKDNTELSSMVLPKTWAERLGSLKDSAPQESPSSIPDQPENKVPEPAIAKTLGEYALGAVGIVNKGFADVLDKLDWVQTTAGDAVNQVVLGKEGMAHVKELRDQGVSMPYDVVTVRPFKAAADALRWTSTGTKELPNTVGGNIVTGVASIVPDIAATLLLPEMKTAQVLSNLGIKSASKFGVVLGTEQAIEGAETAETPIQQWTAPAVGFFEGYTTGMLFDGFGAMSSQIGSRISSKVIPQATASTLSNSLLFGGYASAQEVLETGKVTGNTFLTNAGMGLAFGVKDIGKLMYAKGVNTFVATSTDKAKMIAKSEITAEELRDAGIERLKKIEDGTSTDPETDLATAALNHNTANVKAFTDEIKVKPDEILQSIEESTLDAKLKENIVDKVNEVVADNDPIAQQAKPLSDEIKSIDKKIAAIKKNKTLSSAEVELKTTELDTQKEILINRIRDIYDPNSFREGDVIQDQNTERGRSVKGSVTKTSDGVVVKDELTADIEVKTSDDVRSQKEITKAELKEVEEELKVRGQVDEEAPYRIAGETYNTQKQFINGLTKLAKEGIDAEIINSPDLKHGDVPLGDVLKIIESSTQKAQGLIRPDVKVTSEQELLSRKEMFTRRLERLDVADKVLSGRLKKPKTDQNKPSEPEVASTTAQGEKVPTIEDKTVFEPINYTVKESDNKFVVDLRNKTTDKLIPVKLKEFEQVANDKLEAARSKVIEDIQIADAKAKKSSSYVEYKGDRYKIIPRQDGTIVVTKYGKRVSNKEVLDRVTEQYKKDSAELSDVQMRVYDENIAKIKKDLTEEIAQKVRDYENERRRVVLTQKDEATFSGQGSIASKPTDTQQPVQERGELPSEQAAHKKRVIDEWDQFKKELAIRSKAAKGGAKEALSIAKERADNLLDVLNSPKDIREQIKKEAVNKGLAPKTTEYNKFVKEQYAKRNPFQDIPERVYQNMVKKATEASLSDAKLRQAEQYIDKALTDAEFVRHETERMDYVDKVEKLTAPKNLLQKGQRGGSSPKVKKKLLDYSGDITNIDALRTINELVTKGTSKKYPDPAKTASVNQERIDKLRDELDKETELVELEKITKEIDALQDENALLEYAGIHDMEIYRLKDKLEDAQRIYDEQKTKTQEAREQLKKIYGDLVESLVTEGIISKKREINPKTGVASPVKDPPARVNATRLLKSTNFWSLNDIIMRKSNYTSGTLPIMDNRLNAHYAPMIMKALNNKAQRSLDQHQEWVSGLKEIFGVKEASGSMKRLIIDLETKPTVKVDLTHKDGVQTLELPVSQAIEKILQWKSADGRRSMEKVSSADDMMGYTQESVDRMIEQLKPEEVKLMDFMVNLMGKYSDVYDQAYIKENGISMKSVNDFYWTLSKLKETVVKEQIGDLHIDASIRKDRTIKRTKDSSPLKYGSAIGDLTQFINEAIHYESWAGAIRELQYVYKDPNVRKAIRATSGRDAVAQMDKNIKSFAGNLQAEHIHWLDQASGLYAAGTLGLKVIPMVNQIAASVYYMADMPPLEFANAMRKASIGRFDAREQALRSFLKNDIFVKERKATTSTAYGEEINTVASQVREYGSNPKLTKAMSRLPLTAIKEASGTLLREGDLVPIVSIGSGYVEYKYKQYSGKKLTTDIIERASKGDIDVNFEKALTDWRFFSEVTQQSLRASNRSAFSQSGTLGRTISLFTSGQASAHRVLSSYVRAFNKARRTGDKAAMGHALQGIAVMHVLGGATFGLIDGLTNTTDNKDIIQSVLVGMALGNLEGIALLGRGVAMAKAQLTGKPWGKDFKVQLMPVLRNFENLAKYSNDIITLSASPVKDEEAIANATGKLMVSLSMFAGLPVQGSARLMKGVEGAITKEHDVVSWQTIGATVQDDPIYRPSEEYPLGLYKNFQEAQDDAKRYMVFHEGTATKIIDKFREEDKAGRFEMDMSGLTELITKAAYSGQSPSKVLVAAFNDRVRDRLKTLYGKGKNLNTIEEVKRVLKETKSMPESDREIFEDLLDLWSEYNPPDEISDGIDKIEDLLDKSGDITERQVITK